MKKQTNPSIKAQILRSAFILLSLVAVSAIPFALAQSRSHGTAKRSVAASAIRADRTLTFADRVAYQHAIEDVYWRHRIWPKENAKPKPSLDEVVSAEQIEKKVEDYLRDSQALEAYRQKPIASEQLQAEMERMARNTRQPEVLLELFEALGNDPSVIAECVVRPVLTERLVAELSANDKGPRFALLRTQAGGTELSITTLGTVAYLLPEISNPDGCIDNTWTDSSTTNAPLNREFHTAVWTGTEMIVWGGYLYDSTYHWLNTGGRYIPSTDSWAATSTINAPDGRQGHTAVWTGTEMIVWGGYFYDVAPHWSNTGARYNPSTDSWTATNLINAPDARAAHTAVWTSTEMIVWGGAYRDFSGLHFANTGGRYNPGTDTWTNTSTTNTPDARAGHTAVWTSTEMIVWGGSYLDDSGYHYFNTGGRYNPATDSWTPTSTTNAPGARVDHTAVWTGSEMTNWGGYDGSFVSKTGGRYNPSTDTWTATSITTAPDPRRGHTAVWTDSEMINWGGFDGNSVINTGGRYNPSTDSWTATSPSNAPQERVSHTAVWTGMEMIVWGGTDLTFYLNTGGRYCARSPRHAATPRPRPTPAPRP